MHSTRSIWIAETLVSFALMVLIFSRLSGGEARAFFFAELAAFTVSFLSARFLGGPGKVLLIGIGLAFGFATLLAIAVSGELQRGRHHLLRPRRDVHPRPARGRRPLPRLGARRRARRSRSDDFVRRKVQALEFGLDGDRP